MRKLPEHMNSVFTRYIIIILKIKKESLDSNSIIDSNLADFSKIISDLKLIFEVLGVKRPESLKSLKIQVFIVLSLKRLFSMADLRLETLIS